VRAYKITIHEEPSLFLVRQLSTSKADKYERLCINSAAVQETTINVARL